MNTIGRFVRISALVVIALTIALLRGPSAMAGGSATVTIHKAECPTGVGGAIFEQCHDNGLGGVDFAIGPEGGIVVYTTDDNGVIGPVTVPAGEDIGIGEDPDTLAQYLGAYVYCSDQTTGEVLFDSDLDGTFAVVGTFSAGAEIVCDWYDITPASSGNTSSGSTTTTTLPATGIGAMPSSGAVDLALLALAAGTLLLAGTALRKRGA